MGETIMVGGYQSVLRDGQLRAGNLRGEYIGKRGVPLGGVLLLAEG